VEVTKQYVSGLVTITLADVTGEKEDLTHIFLYTVYESAASRSGGEEQVCFIPLPCRPVDIVRLTKCRSCRLKPEGAYGDDGQSTANGNKKRKREESVMSATGDDSQAQSRNGHGGRRVKGQSARIDDD
jgi:hypothetical protein